MHPELIETSMITETLRNSFTYEEYRNLIESKRAAGETTGPNNSEAMLYYTDLNIGRMNKWDKRFELQGESKEYLQNFDRKELWLVISEGWCGDAAHALPVMNKIASGSENIELRIVLRDENLVLMDRYLTNGGRGIPKLIRLDAETHEEMGTWGPRPEEAQKLFTTAKTNGQEKSEINKQLQIWYARNRGAAIEKELMSAIEIQTQNTI